MKNQPKDKALRPEHVVQCLPRRGRGSPTGDRALSPGPVPSMGCTMTLRSTGRGSTIRRPSHGLPDFLKTTINRERYFWRWNTEEKYQTNMRAYLRMVSGIDGAIGRFHRGARGGRASPTTPSSSTPPTTATTWGTGGFAGKWSHYEESLRVPLIICNDPRVSRRGPAGPGDGCHSP